jgi:hypothetical protein
MPDTHQSGYASVVRLWRICRTCRVALTTISGCTGARASRSARRRGEPSTRSRSSQLTHPIGSSKSSLRSRQKKWLNTRHRDGPRIEAAKSCFRRRSLPWRREWRLSSLTNRRDRRQPPLVSEVLRLAIQVRPARFGARVERFTVSRQTISAGTRRSRRRHGRGILPRWACTGRVTAAWGIRPGGRSLESSPSAPAGPDSDRLASGVPLLSAP